MWHIDREDPSYAKILFYNQEIKLKASLEEKQYGGMGGSYCSAAWDISGLKCDSRLKVCHTIT